MSGTVVLKLRSTHGTRTVEVPFDADATLWSTLQRLAPGDEAPLSGCAHAVCGGCTRLVDGKPRQACATLLGAVTAAGRTLTVGELPAYAGAERPALGDPPTAAVLREVTATGVSGFGEVPTASAEALAERERLGRCLSCGACIAVCDGVADGDRFAGAVGLVQVRRAMLDAPHAERALVDGALRAGLVDGCVGSRACVDVCPVSVPTVDAIGAVAHAARGVVTRWWLG